MFHTPLPVRAICLFFSLSLSFSLFFFICVRACVRVCVWAHACVRACVHACVRACVRVRVSVCLCKTYGLPACSGFFFVFFFFLFCFVLNSNVGIRKKIWTVKPTSFPGKNNGLQVARLALELQINNSALHLAHMPVELQINDLFVSFWLCFASKEASNGRKCLKNGNCSVRDLSDGR